MFVQVPEWLLHLRTCSEFVEIPYQKGIPFSYWRLALPYEPLVGVCVGHWYFDCGDPYCRLDHFQVAIIFENGNVHAFGPFELFPAEKPSWWTVPECWRPR